MVALGDKVRWQINESVFRRLPPAGRHANGEGVSVGRESPALPKKSLCDWETWGAGVRALVTILAEGFLTFQRHS